MEALENTVKNLTNYGIVALAGALGGFAFAPSPLGFVAFLAFVPLIIVLERNLYAHNHNRLLYTFFFCFHGAANWWVMSWQKETDPYLMAAGAGLWLGHPFFLMPAWWMYLYSRKRQGIAPSLALLLVSWTAIEWLHSLSDASYPWLALGYTQVYHTALIQIADIGGVWIVGFFVMLVNVLIAHWYCTRQKTSAHSALTLAVVVLVATYGTWRIHNADNQTPTPVVRVGLVQPSINPWVKWRGGITDMMGLHQHLQDSLNRIHHCDLSIWSETAIPIGLTLPENERFLGRLKDWVDSSGTSLLTGFADYEFFDPEKAPANAQSTSKESSSRFRVFNAALLMNPHDSSLSRHHKSRLTPFGEYMPFSDDFPAIRSWLQWSVGISGWNKGEGATALSLRASNEQATSTSVGPIICIESIYPNYCADYVRRGAQVLAVITNDAWYDGTFGPEQHYCISRMRAVETHRDIMRCGNTGISGCIDWMGRSVEQAPARRSVALYGEAHTHTEKTLYVQFGDWFPELCTILSIALIAMSATKKKTTLN